MPDGIFYIVLNMSIAACFVIAVLLLVRLIRPLPRRFVYPLWALAFFRLVIPFSPAFGWSMFNFMGSLVKKLVPFEAFTGSKIHLPASTDMTVMNMVGAAESYRPVTYKTEYLKQIFAAGSVIWSVVAAALLLAFGIMYLLTYRELRNADHVRESIYSSEMVLSPVLAGVFRPRIILPDGVDPDSTAGKMILEHENVHRRRLDNLWRLLAAAVACIHWFNPLVWVMIDAFFRDMELSCDEAVLRRGKYDSDACRAYASTLLQFSGHKSFAASSSFARSGVRKRIINVLNYRKMTLISAAASAVFVLAIALALFTNPSLKG